MSQMQWTYIDDFGRRYKVGLYHGIRTGHLMIHCNRRVVLIDFHVIQDRKYSFLINDDLCDVHIERQKSKFAYGLEIKEGTNPELRRRRRTAYRRDAIKSVICACLVMLMIAVSSFLMLGGKVYF